MTPEDGSVFQARPPDLLKRSERLICQLTISRQAAMKMLRKKVEMKYIKHSA
jgi:4-hydroxy-3-methylbut-2-enyl diphosphate reductase IspH